MGKDYLLPEITQVPGGPCHHLHNQHYVTLCVENIRQGELANARLFGFRIESGGRAELFWERLQPGKSSVKHHRRLSFSIVLGLIMLLIGEGNFLPL